jgi:hypothetical protein
MATRGSLNSNMSIAPCCLGDNELAILTKGCVLKEGTQTMGKRWIAVFRRKQCH